MKVIGKYLLLFVATFVQQLQAQTDSGNLIWSGYLEAYYGYDFGKPANNNRPAFVYSHNRHNEVSINLAYLKAAYTSHNVRANVALMTGTYANANLAAEPGVLKNIYEANVGIKLLKNKNTWLDAGVFASHIGFESAVSKDCWALTRSMMADNSPYYESGVKITQTSKNEKWLISALYLNGWQRIQRIPGNSTPAFGHQLCWKPNADITLNSSSFVGNDQPDTAKKMRYFHNLYGIFQLNKHIGIVGCFDIGFQQKNTGSNQYSMWYSPALVVRYQFKTKYSLASRIESYVDPDQVIIATGLPFQTTSYSFNFDYRFMENAHLRAEYRSFNSQYAIFVYHGLPSISNRLITGSLVVSF